MNNISGMKETKVITLNNTRKDQDKPAEPTRAQRRQMERDRKKRAKKANGLYNRWIQAKEKGDTEEIVKVENEIKELNKKK